MAEEERPALEVRRLVKTFGGKENPVTVLDGVDLRLARSDFVAVMGPSGSGKSTLLHLIAGLLTCDGGEIWVGGERISEMGDAAVTRFRRRRIGLVFQDFNLIPTLTAEENIALPLLLDRKTPEPSLIEAVLARFALTPRRTHLPDRLSGGERQRVAIARALVTRPDIVLADEPTGNLDSATSMEIIELLQKLNQEGKTIIMVTHEPDIAKFARKRLYMRDGKIQKVEG